MRKQAGTQQDVDNKAIEIALNNTYLFTKAFLSTIFFDEKQLMIREMRKNTF